MGEVHHLDHDQMKLIPEFLSGIDYMIKRSEELGIREKLVIIKLDGA